MRAGVAVRRRQATGARELDAGHKKGCYGCALRAIFRARANERKLIERRPTSVRPSAQSAWGHAEKVGRNCNGGGAAARKL